MDTKVHYTLALCVNVTDIVTYCHMYLNVFFKAPLGSKIINSNSKTISKIQRKKVRQEEFWTAHEPPCWNMSLP